MPPQQKRKHSEQSMQVSVENKTVDETLMPQVRIVFI